MPAFVKITKPASADVPNKVAMHKMIDEFAGFADVHRAHQEMELAQAAEAVVTAVTAYRLMVLASTAPR